LFLELIFQIRAQTETALLAGTTAEEQAWKAAKQMEGVYKDSAERKCFTEGWKMSGRIHQTTVNFSKKNYALSGISGELQLLYSDDKLISLSFWTDGSDADFAKLYRVLVAACNSTGKREVQDKNDSKVKWVVVGNTFRYDIELSHRRWGNSGELERGMSIDIKHPPAN
jgi:hypothetical protein